MKVVFWMMLTQKGLWWVLVQRAVKIQFSTPERMSVRVTVPIVADLAIFKRISVVMMGSGSEQGPL